MTAQHDETRDTQSDHCGASLCYKLYHLAVGYRTFPLFLSVTLLKKLRPFQCHTPTFLMFQKSAEILQLGVC